MAMAHRRTEAGPQQSEALCGEATAPRRLSAYSRRPRHHRHSHGEAQLLEHLQRLPRPDPAPLRRWHRRRRAAGRSVHRGRRRQRRRRDPARRPLPLRDLRPRPSAYDGHRRRTQVALRGALAARVVPWTEEGARGQWQRRFRGVRPRSRPRGAGSAQHRTTGAGVAGCRCREELPAQLGALVSLASACPVRDVASALLRARLSPGDNARRRG
mmetsp:Transcript_13328/g.32337  ORF Transcript_13328/g.32337 Transcript_13328/m.32337 type:complete len:213 (-) Transcript_13328:502-1140(-)